VTNLYLVKSKSALAQLYDMAPACLETHHSFRAFELLTSSDDHDPILAAFAPGTLRPPFPALCLSYHQPLSLRLRT
jgi:hypothetical protein